MKYILVPTDFSEVSRNAAFYAVQLAKSFHVTKIILYNAYQAPVIAEPGMSAIPLVDYDVMKEISSSGLNQLRAELLAQTEDDIEFDVVSEFGMLDTGINDVCLQQQADLVVMGITGGNNMEEFLFGSTATNVAQHSNVPVIIVPPNARFKGVQTIAFASDFKHVKDSTPIEEIKKILEQTGARLHIIHIDEGKESAADQVAPKAVLNNLFSNYNPEFSFIQNSDFVDGIHQFTNDNDVDLIITIPKKHGLFNRLFKKSHTKHLAFHTTIPLMCIHEEEE